MRFLIPLLLTLNITGCAAFLWPHRVQHTPGVSGVVLSDGVPAPSTTVHLHHSLDRKQCGPSKLFSTTDAAGTFSFNGRKELELLVVMGDRPNRWALCIESNGQFIDGWRAIGVGYPPNQISFTCDLQSEPQLAQRGRGICRPGA